jgi:hypothetical protein
MLYRNLLAAGKNIWSHGRVDKVRLGGQLILGVLAGILVGSFGTTAHRSIFAGIPVGIVVALALTASTALLVRAAFGFPAFAAYGLGWILAVQLLALPDFGGSLLITSPQASIPFAAAGVVWNIAGAALLVICALLPQRWFAKPKKAVPTEPESSVGLVNSLVNR